MFSTREYLEKKTGPYGINRFSYLQSLVTEFQDSDSEEARIQVLANLANFAYDPINYGYFKTLNIIDLFLDCLTESNDRFVEYAIAGLCNLCLDKKHKDYIFKNNGVKLITSCLSSCNENTVLSAITTLMFLITPISKKEIITLPIIDAMLQFKESKNPNLSNVATVYLLDYCSEREVAQAMEARNQLSELNQSESDQ